MREESGDMEHEFSISVLCVHTILSSGVSWGEGRRGGREGEGGEGEGEGEEGREGGGGGRGGGVGGWVYKDEVMEGSVYKG